MHFRKSYILLLPNPNDQILSEIKHSIYSFIWDNKPEKIKRNIISQNRENGGLQVPDIVKYTNAIKASWVKRIGDENNKGV